VTVVRRLSTRKVAKAQNDGEAANDLHDVLAVRRTRTSMK
jgi:hypothetical protein